MSNSNPVLQFPKQPIKSARQTKTRRVRVEADESDRGCKARTVRVLDVQNSMTAKINKQKPKRGPQ